MKYAIKIIGLKTDNPDYRQFDEISHSIFPLGINNKDTVNELYNIKEFIAHGELNEFISDISVKVGKIFELYAECSLKYTFDSFSGEGDFDIEFHTVEVKPLEYDDLIDLLLQKES